MHAHFPLILLSDDSWCEEMLCFEDGFRSLTLCCDSPDSFFVQIWQLDRGRPRSRRGHKAHFVFLNLALLNNYGKHVFLPPEFFKLLICHRRAKNVHRVQAILEQPAFSLRHMPR